MPEKGIGRKLVEGISRYAREKSYRILPVCPFAKNIMYRKLEEYRDLL
jgi:predicted GNAT family acetyltransferase